MNTKTVASIAVLAVIIGLTVVNSTAIKRQQAGQPAAPQKPALQQPARPLPPVAPSPAVPATTPAEKTVPTPPIELPKAPAVAVKPPSAPIVQPRPANAAGDQDPLAREALSDVGADPDATAYWVSAINNPDLSAHERQNLIEDLNEDGLSDPDNPSMDDLPLILSRIRLIKLLAPNAMDQVNADAFAEAYKDLVNMVSDLASQ